MDGHVLVTEPKTSECQKRLQNIHRRNPATSPADSGPFLYNASGPARVELRRILAHIRCWYHCRTPGACFPSSGLIQGVPCFRALDGLHVQLILLRHNRAFTAIYAPVVGGDLVPYQARVRPGSHKGLGDPRLPCRVPESQWEILISLGEGLGALRGVENAVQKGNEGYSSTTGSRSILAQLAAARPRDWTWPPHPREVARKSLSSRGHGERTAIWRSSEWPVHETACFVPQTLEATQSRQRTGETGRIASFACKSPIQRMG